MVGMQGESEFTSDKENRIHSSIIEDQASYWDNTDIPLQLHEKVRQTYQNYLHFYTTSKNNQSSLLSRM